MLLLTVSLLCCLLCSARAFTPYVPTNGWTYYIEAARELSWPSCAFRFMSYPSSCDAINLWDGAGINQQFTFVGAPGGAFYLRTSCGRYLSYPGDCGSHGVDTWPEAGVNQAFVFSPAPNGNPFEYYIEALGRANCPFRFLSFPVPCTTNRPDLVDMWDAEGRDQTFRIHPVAAPSNNHPWNSPSPCADPFAWYSNSTGKYQVLCTSGLLDLLSSPLISGPDTKFVANGSALSGQGIPGWASSGSRWAPENIAVEVQGKQFNVIFWAQMIDSEGTHRIGWVSSSTGDAPHQWNHFAPNFLNLGMQRSGDIDAHVFADGGNHYLVWKTDDNSIGWTYTRIWAQQISFSLSGGQLAVSQIGSPRVILDSTGLWWSTSWVSGGSLIEGPEIVYQDGYYYLFFASGRYCESTYMEGVARSRSVLGPYEKMLIPLLSTGLVGSSNGGKLLGPGHGSFVKDVKNGQWNVVYHASTEPDSKCVRYPFVNTLGWNGGWPYVEV